MMKKQAKKRAPAQPQVEISNSARRQIADMRKREKNTFRAAVWALFAAGQVAAGRTGIAVDAADELLLEFDKRWGKLL